MRWRTAILEIIFVTPEEQKKAGVTPEMLRLSVGIEHIDDILADLSQALEAAKG